MQTDLTAYIKFYEESKFWIPVLGVVYWGWRGFIWLQDKISWLKEIKTNDLHRIQEGITDFNVKLKEGLEKQTLEFVHSATLNTNELKELRSDVQLLTSAILNATAVKAARARKKK